MYVVSAFRRTVTVRLKPDTTYEKSYRFRLSVITAAVGPALQ